MIGGYRGHPSVSFSFATFRYSAYSYYSFRATLSSSLLAGQLVLTVFGYLWLHSLLRLWLRMYDRLHMQIRSPVQLHLLRRAVV